MTTRRDHEQTGESMKAQPTHIDLDRLSERVEAIYQHGSLPLLHFLDEFRDWSRRVVVSELKSDGHEQRHEDLDGRLDRIEGRIDQVFYLMIGLMVAVVAALIQGFMA